ncbi:MAG: methyltransferase [Byssovorax sp.]
MSWERASLAPDATHHVIDGEPLYDARFDEVLKFHPPGLAPARRANDAWHIRSDGSPAYARRFVRTFGFYEGLAAVTSIDGWHHVHPDGSDVYATRHAWCGNFQGGLCPARDHDGAYLHLTTTGAPAYPLRWRYAGDFRDGVGVVQGEDGRSTHIDGQGRSLHHQWFLDLDVFHKGFARARDEEGWTHIDSVGRPLYARRFAAVEPFYNGQSRVERLDGAIEVIDERGSCLVEVRAPMRSDLAALSGDLVGFWRTQTIRAAVELGVFEALPATATSVAKTCNLVPERAGRLLRALAELQLAARSRDTWSTTSRGAHLRADHLHTLAHAAVEYGDHFSRMWEALPEALRAGTNWHAPDIFAIVSEDQPRAEGHHRMLQSYARHDYAEVPGALGLAGDERLVDAGGGLGILARLLLERYPAIQVVLLDRPEVVAMAAARGPHERLELRATDLFEDWSVAGDAVLMARVLHDWDDGPALRLLRRARGALRPGGRLFAVEMVLEEEGSAGGLCDLHLLVATGGKERTAAQYAALLKQAGFDFAGVRRIPALPSILVGVAR